jgi:hypothetical protein
MDSLSDRGLRKRICEGVRICLQKTVCRHRCAAQYLNSVYQMQAAGDA